MPRSPYAGETTTTTYGPRSGRGVPQPRACAGRDLPACRAAFPRCEVRRNSVTGAYCRRRARRLPGGNNVGRGGGRGALRPRRRPPSACAGLDVLDCRAAFPTCEVQENRRTGPHCRLSADHAPGRTATGKRHPRIPAGRVLAAMERARRAGRDPATARRAVRSRWSHAEKRAVWERRFDMTSSGLTRADLMVGPTGAIISRAKHENGKRQYARVRHRLQPHQFR